jgi:cold shock CspA family protein
LEAAPSSAVVRYLLGKLLTSEGSLADALTVLHEGVRLHPDDPNLCMTYGLALHADGRPYSESAAALNLGRTRGVRDPAYVATLGGFLVMNKDLDEAKAVFADADRRGFGFGEASRIAFAPQRDGSPVVLDGRVAKVGAGFAFLRSAGMPDFYFRMSRADGVRLVEGQKCKFVVGFSSRGPSAVEVEV